MYNETVLDHFNNPRNVGKIEDGVIGEVSSPGCGDTTFIYLDIEDGVIKLGGLPEVKINCSVLAADALRKAIAQYEEKHQ